MLYSDGSHTEKGPANLLPRYSELNTVCPEQTLGISWKGFVAGGTERQPRQAAVSLNSPPSQSLAVCPLSRSLLLEKGHLLMH